MPLNRLSRAQKGYAVQALTVDKELAFFYEIPQTTVQEYQLPDEFDWYAVAGGETFESIAYREYPTIGGPGVWWVLATVNPEIIYPLDLQAGDKIRLPPSGWVEQFLGSLDDWTLTWPRVEK